ncbi:MAG: hypothetical protein LDL33_15085 [Desulfomonile sp.]|nr:hypothetical protein [Desulfomonile sp.]
MHIFFATGFLLLTLSFLGGAWRRPVAAIVSLAGIANAVLAVVGLVKRRKWARWFLLSMVLLVALPTIAFLAGSILWLESFAAAVMAILGVFAACEVAGWFAACGVPATPSNADSNE